MRKILFRGKPLVEIKETAVIIDRVDGFIYGDLVTDAGTERRWISIPYYGEIIVNPETIGQFTGLYDKNHKRIFEGDIIKIGYYISPPGVEEEEILGIVRCDVLYGCYVEAVDKSYFVPIQIVEKPNEEIEIVGNIYDNHELLEGE